MKTYVLKIIPFNQSSGTLVICFHTSELADKARAHIEGITKEMSILVSVEEMVIFDSDIMLSEFLDKVTKVNQELRQK